MDKIRTGLAAYGMSGRVFHAPFISTNPHFELIAVTERSKELSREKYPDACIVRSFGELIGLEGLDLVVINTPDSTHYEYARRALEAGKHVVVEKPFTTTVAEAEELVALAASRGLTLSVYQNRPVGRRFSDGQGNTVQKACWDIWWSLNPPSPVIVILSSRILGRKPDKMAVA